MTEDTPLSPRRSPMTTRVWVSAHWKAVLLGLVLVAVAASVRFVFFPPIAADVPAHDTGSLGVPRSPDFLLRLDASGDLLLAREEFESRAHAAYGHHPDGPPERVVLGQWVLRYSKANRTMETVPKLVWERATGEVAAWATGWMGGRGIRIEDGKLWAPDGEIRVTGSAAVSWSVDPTETILAVVSGNGWKRPTMPSMMSLLSSPTPGGYVGQHFVELFAFPSFERRGRPIRIPLTTAKGAIRIGWSAQGQYSRISQMECS